MVRASLMKDVDTPYTGARVTCLKLGEVMVEILIGNRESSTNK